VPCPEGEAVTVALIDAGGAELARWHLGAPVVDLVVVDVLARWQLDARRRGASIRVRGCGPGLLALLELVGLAALVEGTAPP